MSQIKTNVGNDQQALMMGGGGVGYFGTATATSSTSLTATGTPWVSGAHVGRLVVTSSGVFGVITANTSSVLTVDRWYNPATPGGTAATTPSSTTTFSILPGGAPLQFMALTANNTAPSATDTSLSGEITTVGGGLIRQLATYAHTTGVAGYTLTGTFTANGADSLPVVVAKMGVFTGMVSGQMGFETLLSATATLAASGDQLVCTQSVAN